MSNLSLFKAAGLADVKSMASSLLALKRNAPSRLGGAIPLKLDKGQGEWCYGFSEDTEELGTQRVAINPVSFTQGWVIWGDAEILFEEMASVALDMPERPEPIAGNEPKLQLGFMAALKDGTQLIYKNNSLSGREFVQELATVIGERVASGADDCVPLLELASTHYRHRKYGRIFKPTFTVVGWTSLDSTAKEEKEEEGEAPRPRRRRV